VGVEQPFKPVEMRPLHHISVMPVLSMKQEATPNRRVGVHLYGPVDTAPTDDLLENSTTGYLLHDVDRPVYVRIDRHPRL